MNPFNPYFFTIWTCYQVFFLVHALIRSYISKQQMWSPPKFATAFPKSSRCQIPKHKRHRNPLLVGLQRSPLSGPSSFLGNNLLGISIFQGQSRFYVQSKFFVMATKCTYVLNPIGKFNRQIQSGNSTGVFKFTHIKLLKNWQVGTEIDGCAFAREAIGIIWTVFTTQIEVFDHKTWHITSCLAN